MQKSIIVRILRGGAASSPLRECLRHDTQSFVRETRRNSQAEERLCHRDEDARSKKAAFTLAEVLITLGIIGVVAALTLPTLIHSYRKHVVETKLARFYSVISQAVKMAEVEYGDSAYWDDIGTSCELKDEDAEVLECVEGTESPLLWYNKYLAKYVKAEIMNVNIASLNNASIVVAFPDGTLTTISGNGWNFYTSQKAYQTKNSQEFGIDAFPFIFYKGKGLSYFGSTSYDGDCSSGRRGVSCLKLIMQNGWKIPDDYPFKF